MTLTCKIGKFVFGDNTKLSTAKLIRDTVQGQVLIPKDGRKLKTAEDCENFVEQLFPEFRNKLERVILLPG